MKFSLISVEPDHGIRPFIVAAWRDRNPAVYSSTGCTAKQRRNIPFYTRPASRKHLGPIYTKQDLLTPQSTLDRSVIAQPSLCRRPGGLSGWRVMARCVHGEHSQSYKTAAVTLERHSKYAKTTLIMFCVALNKWT